MKLSLVFLKACKPRGFEEKDLSFVFAEPIKPSLGFKAKDWVKKNFLKRN